MKAVVLEDYAIQQGDLDWSGVKALVPDITRYGRTAQEEVGRASGMRRSCS